MKIIMLGAPGAGKGTQAEVVSQKYNIPVISTGNIIRDAIKNNTELGNKAKSFIDEGYLVPDDVVIDLVSDRLKNCKSGFILDGFPRTIPQAQALDEMGTGIDKVIDLDVKDEEIVVRLSGRRVCEECGTTYHVSYKPTKVLNKCDKCGGSMILRDDDKPETIKSRLAVYHTQTEPLKQYYENQKKLYKVLGQVDIKDTTRLTLETLEA